MRAVVMVIGLALAAGPVWAADEPASAAKDDKDKVVCKNLMRENSRFPVRTCMTRGEWEQQAETAMKAFSEVQNRPNVFVGKGN